MTRQLIHSGSVKDVYALDDGKIEFEFSDRISVFDKPIPNTVPGKGQALCDMAAFWFELLSENGIPNHFIARTGPAAMKVEAVKIIPERDKIAADGSTNHLVPLECILRHFVAGSLWDRLQKGAIDGAALGFAPGVRIDKGMRLPKPMFEVSTKLEAVDRLLDRAEAKHIAKMDDGALDGLFELCLKIDALIDARTVHTNLIHVDGKKEFGFDAQGRLMVVDVFGTADEDRWWDRRLYQEKGEMVELSKEAVRRHYRDIGYHAALYGARERGQPEPDIPPMPEALVAEVSALYRSIADQIVGG